MTIFGLNTYLDSQSVQTAISQVFYTGQGTFIEYGMAEAISNVFDQAGDRPSIPDVMIVITDGQDASNVTGAQQAAALKNITVFAIGVGAYVDYNQMVAVAGAPERVYNATDFDFLTQVLADVCDNLGKIKIQAKFACVDM